MVFAMKGDSGKAIEYCELAIEKDQPLTEEAWAKLALGFAWCLAGDSNKGIPLLIPGMEILRAGREVLNKIVAFPFVSKGFCLAGEHEKARKIAEELLGLAEDRNAKLFIGVAHRLLGDATLESNPQKAIRHFENAISIASEIKAENELALAYSGMGRYYKQKGNTAQAKEYLTKALAIFERLGTLIEPEKVRNELAELHQ